MQQAIVYIIGAALAAYVLYRLLRLILRRGGNDLCSSCPAAQQCHNNMAECGCGDLKSRIMNAVKNWSGERVEEWFRTSGWGALAAGPAGHIDKRQAAVQAHANPAEWNAALKFLRDTDFAGAEPGKYPLSGGGTYATVSEYLTRESAPFEAHRKFIDIQFIVSGREYIDVAPLGAMSVVRDDYNPEKDIMFFTVSGYERRLADSGRFLILFPGDAHRPCMSVEKAEPVKKVVVKVPFAEP